jgi:hypothetical protein
MSTRKPRGGEGESRLVEGRDELNFAEFPIALLADRMPADRNDDENDNDDPNTLEFCDHIMDRGKPVTRRLIITAPKRYGLPTASDADVIVALIQLTKLKNNLTQRQVPFSKYEILKLLGWPDKGRYYRRLEESFDRWASVYLSYEKAWWDNSRKSWVDEKFHVLERVSIYERDPSRKAEGGQLSLAFSSFTWNEVIFGSFQAGYMKRLDFSFFRSLQTATAKQMYRFLDKHFYHRSRLEYDLSNFAFEHIGLSRRYNHTGVVKQKLAPAIEELEAKGFLEPLAASERYCQVRRGEWKVVFIRKDGEPKDREPERPSSNPLEEELVRRGITRATARKLVATCPAERIAKQLEVFDWRQESKDHKLSENPAGWLAGAVKEDYPVPPLFEPRADRERKVEEAAEKKRKLEDAQKRREAEVEARRAAERAPVDAYLAALSESGRRDLEETAMREASREDWQQYKGAKPGGHVAEHTRNLIIRKHVQRILEEKRGESEARENA